MKTRILSNRITFFLAGAVVLLVFQSTISWAALIADGGFETPVLTYGAVQDFGAGSTIDDWTVLGDPLGNNVDLDQTFYAESYNGMNQFNAREGSNCVDLTGGWNTGPNSGVQQTISTVEGTTYQLSFSVGRGTGNNYYANPATVDLSINGGPRVPFTNSNSTTGMINWEDFTTSYMATGSSTTIAFLNGTPIDTMLAGLDNVSITIIPEPSTIVMLAGLSVALLLAFRRRCVRR